MTLGDEGDCELQYQADIDGFAFELPLGECGMALSRSRFKIKNISWVKKFQISKPYKREAGSVEGHPGYIVFSTDVYFQIEAARHSIGVFLRSNLHTRLAHFYNW